MTGVTTGTAAKKAGLQKGDVILLLNSDLIENSNDLWNAVADARTDATVDLELVRNKVSLILSIRLDERPRKAREPDINSSTKAPTPKLGFAVQKLTLEIA
jgi:S1-C subfamily serine protease